MKREERTIYNHLRRSVNPDTIRVEIPTAWTHEARQACHELLTTTKLMHAVGIYWNDIRGEYCLNYAPGQDQKQESEDVDTITATFTPQPWTWTGYRKPDEPTTEAEEEGEKTMDTTKNTTRKPESERARKQRENQEKRHIETLAQIAKALEGNTAARIALALQIGRAITYHESGKIEGLFSLDTACSNNDFCPRMQATDAPEVICKYCYTRNMWDGATRAHHITGEILSKVEFTAEEAALIPVPGLTVRFNSDGEIINLTHAVNLLRIAATHPAVTFTVWTKRPAILDKAIKQEGKPANLICGVSSPMINIPFREVWSWADFIFTVYTPEGMRRALARGEHECNGRKCMDCGFHCYLTHRSENAGPVYVAEALRKPGEISAKAWPGVIASIDAATLDRQPAEA